MEVIVATVDDELEILFSTDSGVVEADKLLTILEEQVNYYPLGYYIIESPIYKIHELQ